MLTIAREATVGLLAPSNRIDQLGASPGASSFGVFIQIGGYETDWRLLFHAGRQQSQPVAAEETVGVALAWTAISSRSSGFCSVIPARPPPSSKRSFVKMDLQD